jgi:hypothetical protein
MCCVVRGRMSGRAAVMMRGVVRAGGVITVMSNMGRAVMAMSKGRMTVVTLRAMAAMAPEPTDRHPRKANSAKRECGEIYIHRSELPQSLRVSNFDPYH